MRFPSILTLGCLAVCVHGARAATDTPTSASQIQEIRIHGLERTRKSVVERELTIKPERKYDSADLEESVQKLKNLKLFRQVDAKYDNQVVDISVAEKWTLIPIVNFGGGGGSRYFELGLFELNLFGSYLEFAARYDNYSGESGGIVWVKDPRFLNQNMELLVETEAFRRIRTLYTPERQSQGAYFINRIRVGTTLEREILPLWRVGAGVEGYMDDLSYNHISSDDVLLTQKTGSFSPASSRSMFARAIMSYGRLNLDDYLTSGWLSKIQYWQGIPVLGTKDTFGKWNWQTRYYYRLPYRMNLGFNLVLGHSGSADLQHTNYVGVRNVRGLLDEQLRGTDFWQANAEFRGPTWESSWVIIQPTVFMDAAASRNNFAALADFNQQVPWSLGGGVRLHLPRIYGATFRVDYAHAFGLTGGSGISFGLFQYF